MSVLKSINYITCEDIQKLTGKHWSDFEFAQLAANDSYQRLDCSDAALEELYEDLEWETGKAGLTLEDCDDDQEEYEWRIQRTRAVRLKNQINLVEILRKQYGVRFEILVWISW